MFKKKLRIVEQQQIKERTVPMALDQGSRFIYQSGADCAKIWRRHGWVPPTEYRTDYEFGKNREKDLQVKENHE